MAPQLAAGRRATASASHYRYTTTSQHHHRFATMSTPPSDVKRPTMDEEGSDKMLITPPRRSRPLAAGLAIAALLFLSWSSFAPRLSGLHGVPSPSPILDGSTRALVPLEAHIMSKCPDAQDCLRMLVLPTMQRVIDKVNFTLSFIGT